MTKRWLSLLGGNYTSGYPEGSGGDTSGVEWRRNTDGQLESSGQYPALATLSGNPETLNANAGLAVYGVRWTIELDVTYNQPPALRNGSKWTFGKASPGASSVTARLVLDRPGATPNLSGVVLSSPIPATEITGSYPNQIGRWVDPPGEWTYEAGGTGGPGLRGTPNARQMTYVPRRSLPGTEDTGHRWYGTGKQVHEAQQDLPLGLLRAGGGELDPNRWGGGVLSLQSMSSLAAGFVRFTRLSVLVEERPTWSAATPSMVTIGAQPVEFEVRAKRPGGEGLPGLRIRCASRGGGTVLQGDGGGFGSEAVATTDGNGVARFAIAGAVAGIDILRITDAESPSIGGLFSPVMANERRVDVIASPAGGGGQPGDTTCVVIPAEAAIPARPARTELVNDSGWTAGANSIKEVEGDARVTFAMPAPVVAVVIGFTPTRDGPAMKERITHGLYFGADASGEQFVQVFEGGRMRGEPMRHFPVADQFRIERKAGVVTYSINRDEQGWDVIYTSGTPCAYNPVMVGNSIYSSGDMTP